MGGVDQRRHQVDEALQPIHRPAQSEAMSFSTRSSRDLNGSLHSTVRWAWSLSLRCTQSTVKSRRRSLARRMNSPRSLARVVCGRLIDRRLDVLVGAGPLDQAAVLHLVEQPPLPADVVVLEVDQRHLRVGQRHALAPAVVLDQAGA